MPYPVRYTFSQRFVVSAQKAYNWCTEFNPEDHALMGEKEAKRQITQLDGATVILTDAFETKDGWIEKQKLVQLYPHKMFWISTHLSGPNKYSQFLYQISPRSKSASCLEFNALHLEYGNNNLDQTAIKLISEKLHKEDSNGWKLLAKAMAKELCE
jgi:hypothetical protein